MFPPGGNSLARGSQLERVVERALWANDAELPAWLELCNADSLCPWDPNHPVALPVGAQGLDKDEVASSHSIPD